MVFYIPESSRKTLDSETNLLKILIEKYGGATSEYHECFTYQLQTLNDKFSHHHFFQGKVFSAKWIVESVREGQLLDPEQFLAFENSDKDCKRLDFCK